MPGFIVFTICFINTIFTLIFKTPDIMKFLKQKNLLPAIKEFLILTNSIRREAYERKIKSFIAINDIIEIEYYKQKEIVIVENIEVLPNSPVSKPTDLVIKVKLKRLCTNSSIEFTSDNFKYIRHINHKNPPTL